MTSQRCPACREEGKKGKLRLKEEQDTETMIPRYLKRSKTWKCKRCGKEYIKVNRSWRRA